MCEVLPTIPETSPSPDGENTKLEQLMISMLEERDKLMEKLRESQERYSDATRRLGEVEADNGILMRQLQAFMPEDKEDLQLLLDDLRHSGGLANGHSEEMKKWPIAKKYAGLVRELAATREKAEEKEEEVRELKSERNNTRLLLEHLECLVARHEKSLRMTVVKKQTAHQAGMSSEVEVLKALKSLFDHHKALDEKVRERLRAAQERNLFLEDEVMLANQEIRLLQEENRRIKKSQNRNSVLFSKSYDMGGFTKEQLSLLEDRDQTIGDLQFSLDERTAELEEAVHIRDQFSGRVQECEEELSMALKELQREQASVKIISMQNRELVSVRSELESRLSEVECQLSASQQECREVRERAMDMEHQLASLHTKTAKLEEEVELMKSELNTRDQALVSAQALSSEQERLHSEQLQKVVTRHGTDENTIQHLESQLQKASQDHIVATESHVSRLQSTVERMHRESDERLKTHLEERKQLAEERTRYREQAEHRERDLATAVKETEQLREELGALKLHIRLVESKSSPNLSRTAKRYSWQPSMESISSTPPSSTYHIPTSSSSSALAERLKKEKLERVMEEDEGAGVAGPSDGGHMRQAGSKDMSEMELGDLANEDAVAKLMRTLEGQVSQLDKKLEKMGDQQGLAEADQFDQMMQSMAEGSYSNPSLESMPRSSPPGSRLSRKFKPESLPTTIYRVAQPPSPPLPLPPPPSSSPLPQSLPAGSVSPSNSSSSGSNDSNSGNSKQKSRRSSLSKLFGRKNKRRGGSQKHGFKRFSEPVPRHARRFSDPQMRESVDFGELLETPEDREEDRHRKSELLSAVLQRGLHFSHWDTSTLIAWLEVWVGVPYWYIAAIRNCIGNGAVLASLTEAELEQEFGITNTLHRMKLRLAVQEMVSLTSSATPHLARTTSLYGEMGHEWIGDYWLPSLGLPQYSAVFKVCLVDARMLEYLTKKDLRTALKMVDSSHRNSLQYGISVLKKLDYRREEVERRRNEIDVRSKKDVLLWSNEHIQQWVREIGLGDHAHCLNETGVHGGVVALDNGLDHEKLALALQVPLSSFEVRKHLKAEFEKLLLEGTARVSSEPQSHGKIVRKLSKRLKVGTRKLTPPTSDFLPMRPSSPVLFPAHPLPSHFSPLLEEATDSQSSHPKEQTV